MTWAKQNATFTQYDRIFAAFAQYECKNASYSLVGFQSMEWKSVDTQSDLDKLDNSVCWEDSEVLEYYAKFSNEPYLPSDVSRSGWVNKNIHILIDTDSEIALYLEIVLIDCDHFSSLFLGQIYFQGRIHRLKRIESLSYKDA